MGIRVGSNRRVHNAAKPTPQFWSAWTRPRFAQATCRRRTQEKRPAFSPVPEASLPSATKVSTWSNVRYGEWSATILTGDCYNSADQFRSVPRGGAVMRACEREKLFASVRRVAHERSRCGEMADAQDLKSWDRKKSCGFESHHRHHSACLEVFGETHSGFTRDRAPFCGRDST